MVMLCPVLRSEEAAVQTIRARVSTCIWQLWQFAGKIVGLHVEASKVRESEQHIGNGASHVVAGHTQLNYARLRGIADGLIVYRASTRIVTISVAISPAWPAGPVPQAWSAFQSNPVAAAQSCMIEFLPYWGNVV